MIPFQAPLDDILFSLRAVAKAESAGWDAETGTAVLTHFAALAEQVLAPINAAGDRQGCRLQDGRVRMPDGFAAAYQALAEGGWQGLTAPEVFGGQAADAVTAAAVTEIFAGANHALQMVTGLVPGAIKTLLAFGSPAQQAALIPPLAAGDWISTMCLTEPGAGSDLSRIRCRAHRDGDGWRLMGEKIFISGGDQDLSPGILHFVLARSGAPQDGARGLSLFACPVRTDAERAHVQVTRIEEKLGLHASPTCQLVFDSAAAELIGNEGQGLAAMFTLMNHARIDVALQGVAHATRARAIAAEYAAGRSQGRGADGGPALLQDHGDVRRMLDEQASLALGARAMCHVALVEMQGNASAELSEFLTATCKIFGTEAGIRSADLGIQILGGYGYLEEYSLSQIWRDARVTAIYEGANGIHATALATRGLLPGRRKGADDFALLVARLATGAMWLPEALARWDHARNTVAGNPEAGRLAHSFASLTTELLFRAVWHRIAQHSAAHSAPAELLRLNAVVQTRAWPHLG